MSATHPGCTAFPTDWAALLEILRAREVPHGGVALCIEDHQLLVTLQGADADHPPHDEAGFTAFTNSLNSDLASVVAPLEPISGIFRYARTANRRIPYHRIHPWPDGLIIVGDAMCVFNPVYAQGMTVAALEALALQDMLSRRTNLRGFAPRYQRRLAKITAWPWTMATLADQGWQTPPPTSPVIRAGQWYMNKCQDLVPTNQQMFQDFSRLAHMLAGPTILRRPRHLARILLTRSPRHTHITQPPTMKSPEVNYPGPDEDAVLIRKSSRARASGTTGSALVCRGVVDGGSRTQAAGSRVTL